MTLQLFGVLCCMHHYKFKKKKMLLHSVGYSLPSAEARPHFLVATQRPRPYTSILHQAKKKLSIPLAYFVVVVVQHRKASRLFL